MFDIHSNSQYFVKDHRLNYENGTLTSVKSLISHKLHYFRYNQYSVEGIQVCDTVLIYLFMFFFKPSHLKPYNANIFPTIYTPT